MKNYNKNEYSVIFFLFIIVIFFPGWNDGERIHLGEELSDVLLYLIRLSEKCCVDLPIVTLKCLEQKYSVGVSRYNIMCTVLF